MKPPLTEKQQDLEHLTVSQPGDKPSSGGGEKLARSFHESYERLAPQFGYETRPDTKRFDPTTANGRLMIAVCEELLRSASKESAARALVNKQAEDAGLWFVAQTAPEAYLQAGLRELHAAVEGKESAAHTDHPLRHYDRTCPGCQEEVRRDRQLDALVDAAQSAPPSGYVWVERGELEEVIGALDRGLGDTDITHLETDEEIREQAPIQWACTKLSLLLSSAPGKQRG